MQAPPYHIQARALGADLTALRAVSERSSAREILAAWDYHAAGLSVTSAREHLRAWHRSHYHHPEWRDTGEAGRYLRYGREIAAYRTAWLAGMAWAESVPLSTSEQRPTWQTRYVRIIAGGRTIIVEHCEDVDWGARKNPRYPAHTSTYYRSHLVRSAPLSPGQIIAANIYPSARLLIADMAERTITHDLRGHWWARIITELVGAEHAASYMCLPSPVTVYKVVARNGRLTSVYAPDFAYPLGEWVTDQARPKHVGGIYAYRDEETAIQQARDGEVFQAAWIAGRELVLCQCVARGRCVAYAREKWAYSELRVDRVISVVQAG